MACPGAPPLIQAQTLKAPSPNPAGEPARMKSSTPSKASAPSILPSSGCQAALPITVASFPPALSGAIMPSVSSSFQWAASVPSCTSCPQ